MSESLFEELGGILGGLREETGQTIAEEQLAAARRGTTAQRLAERQAKIRALASRGATAGERAAAEDALRRMSAPPTHAEVNQMRRAGNHIEESVSIEDLLSGLQQSQGL